MVTVKARMGEYSQTSGGKSDGCNGALKGGGQARKPFQGRFQSLEHWIPNLVYSKCSSLIHLVLIVALVDRIDTCHCLEPLSHSWITAYTGNGL